MYSGRLKLVCKDIYSLAYTENNTTMAWRNEVK
jgi:hypothetical protein